MTIDLKPARDRSSNIWCRRCCYIGRKVRGRGKLEMKCYALHAQRLLGMLQYALVASMSAKPHRRTNSVGKRFRRSKLRALTFVAVSFMTIAASAQRPSSNTSEVPQVPERLRYLFDVPWCKRWKIDCLTCEKEDDRIVCKRIRTSCGSFELYGCDEYNVPPEQCMSWFDGCNTCERIQCPPNSTNCGHIFCTARACFNFKPRFVCSRRQYF